MSQIDSSMDPPLRETMLSEVRTLLPAFLSSASEEREGPVKAAVELLALPESDLRRVLAVHIMLADPVRRFVAALPRGISRPLTSSVRPRIAGRTVTSGIDWAATARRRATSSPLGDIWVTRPANRVFDIPENRALAWLLQSLQERGRVAVLPSRDTSGKRDTEIRAMSTAIHTARQVAWLEGVPAQWPGDQVYIKLNADRMGFYRQRVSDAVRYLRKLLVSPSPTDIVEALSHRYFEPEQDWKLFEIAVLLRITDALAGVGTRLSGMRLFGETRRRPFAVFQTAPERQVRIWYQSWPRSTFPSELNDAIHHYELRSGGTRPDIVIETVDSGVATRALLLELKASASSAYLSSGFTQLLGYLRDRPGLFDAPASAWLIAPPGDGYRSKHPHRRVLWVTSCDDVAAAVLQAVA